MQKTIQSTLLYIAPVFIVLSIAELIYFNYIFTISYIPNLKKENVQPLLKSKNKSLTKIAFGSCGHQMHELPVFNTIAALKPDYFIFLGDNIYGDTKDMNSLKEKYKMLGNKPSYKALEKSTKILATWDDHDYGWNDAGKEYPFKKESKEIFLDFFKEPKDSERRKHEGIYHAMEIPFEGKNLQIIFLDNRTFRDKLLRYNKRFKHDEKFDFYNKDYQPHKDTTTSLLGKEQWAWLEMQLEKKADIRIICSGTQFGIEWNSYEAWANFPHEQQRMLNLIQKTKANGVFFITGDVHYAELSKIETNFYPIYDFTSSGLSSTWGFATPNANRIAGPMMDNNFGLISIDWSKETIKFEAKGVDSKTNFEKEIKISDLQFK
jgi:alkaline phosphatase D